MTLKHNIDFDQASFKNFENIPNLNAFQRAEAFKDFTDYMEIKGHMNYRFITHNGCGPEILVSSPFLEQPKHCVSLVSNDYLNFIQHPKVKAAAIAGIQEFGTGAGASPLIGGHHEYHVKLENKLSTFLIDLRTLPSFILRVILRIAPHCWQCLKVMIAQL